MSKQFHRSLARRIIATATALLAIGIAATGLAATISNVRIANVTPSAFSVVWQGNAAAMVEVFADAAGSSNLVAQVGSETYPLHSGNADLPAGYERRIQQYALRTTGRALGLGYVRVSHCRPGTTYYFRLSANDGAELFPPASLLNVTTPPANSFVTSSDQLIIDVPGINNDGRIVTLTHSNSLYGLAAVIGDGAGTNQVYFSLSDLLNLAGDANFSATGSQTFSVDVWGANNAHTVQSFDLVLSAGFQIAQAAYQSIGTEFGALGLGSTIVRVGQVGRVPLSFNSSVGISSINVRLQVPTGRLVNFGLSNAVAAVDTLTFTSNSPTSGTLTISARAGESFSGQLQLGELAFNVVSNQSSAFVDLRFAQPMLTKIDAGTLSNVVMQAGRVVVIGAEPLLEAAVEQGARRVTMYGIPWSSYGIEYSTDLNNGGNWRLLTRIPLTNYVVTLNNVHDNQGTYFYRAYEFKANPPLVEASRALDGSRRLLVFGQPGGSYSVQFKTNLNSAVWASLPALGYTLTNSFRTVTGLTTNLDTVFYRLQKN